MFGYVDITLTPADSLLGNRELLVQCPWKRYPIILVVAYNSFNVTDGVDRPNKKICKFRKD